MIRCKAFLATTASSCHRFTGGIDSATRPSTVDLRRVAGLSSPPASLGSPCVTHAPFVSYPLGGNAVKDERSARIIVLSVLAIAACGETDGSGSDTELTGEAAGEAGALGEAGDAAQSGASTGGSGEAGLAGGSSGGAGGTGGSVEGSGGASGGSTGDGSAAVGVAGLAAPIVTSVEDLRDVPHVTELRGKEAAS